MASLSSRSVSLASIREADIPGCKQRLLLTDRPLFKVEVAKLTSVSIQSTSTILKINPSRASCPPLR